MGIQGGLGGEAFSARLAAAGIDMMDYLRLVTAKAVLLHATAGVLMPTWMVVMLTRFFGANRSWTEGLSVLPFTLFGGLAFTVPYVLFGTFLGPEFPSLLGAPVGLAIVVTAARRGFLLPTDRGTSRRAGRVGGGLGERPGGGDGRRARGRGGSPPGWHGRRIALVGVLLVLTRLPSLPVGAWLRAPALTWTDILGTGISATTTPLYLPGFILHGGRGGHRPAAPDAARGTWQRRSGRPPSVAAGGPGIVLVFTVPMVRSTSTPT